MIEGQKLIGSEVGNKAGLCKTAASFADDTSLEVRIYNLSKYHFHERKYKTTKHSTKNRKSLLCKSYFRS